MLTVTKEQSSEQVRVLKEDSKKMSTIYFDNFLKSLEPIYSNSDLPDFIKFPKSIKEMLKGDMEPSKVIDLRNFKDDISYNNLRMWRFNSNKEVTLHGFGLEEGNASRPCMNTLFDTSPHGNIGGATGHGKSVLVNSVMISAMMVQPPWKIQFYLNDPKIAEFKIYANESLLMPHINTVAATTDVTYTLSMLAFLTSIMIERNNLFAHLKIKNVEDFVKVTGLEMPMLVVVLEEVAALYLNAGRLANKIDKAIDAFIAQGRSAGGRCLLASQSNVSGMSDSIMNNINIRAALGCNAVVSNKLIGNSGASINLGKMGKVVLNTKPSDGLVKDNTYFTVPFIPDSANPHSATLPELMTHIKEVYEMIGAPRLEPLSTFNEEDILSKKQFSDSIESEIGLSNVFVGEPSFLVKGKYKYYNISFIPTQRFDTYQKRNIMIVANNNKVRYTLLSLMLFNLENIMLNDPNQQVDINVISSNKETTKLVEEFDHIVTSYYNSDDADGEFYLRVKFITYRNILITADENLFENAEIDDMNLYNEVYEYIESNCKTELNKKRIKYMLDQLKSNKIRAILGLDELNKNNFTTYGNTIYSLIVMADSYGCGTKQLTKESLPIVFNVFNEIDQVRGFEIKTALSKLELWSDVIKSGPIYGIHTIIVASNLASSASSIASAFQYAWLYKPSAGVINALKIRDDMPETVYHTLFTLVNTEDKITPCCNIKFPLMLGDDEVV